MKSETIAALSRVASGISNRPSYAGIREVATSRARMIFSTGIMQGSMAGMAYLNGRFSDDGEIRIPIPFTSLSAPLDLTLGLGFLGASLFGLFGPVGEHVVSAANGFVGCYNVRYFMNVGHSHRMQAGQKQAA